MILIDFVYIFLLCTSNNKQTVLAPAEIHTFIASHETRHWEAQRWCYDQDDLEVQGETTRVVTQSAPTIGLENMEVDNFCHGPLGHEQSFPTKHILLLNSFGLIDCRKRVALTNTSPLQVHMSSTLTTSKQLSAPFQAQKGVRLEHPLEPKKKKILPCPTESKRFLAFLLNCDFFHDLMTWMNASFGDSWVKENNYPPVQPPLYRHRHPSTKRAGSKPVVPALRQNGQRDRDRKSL